MSEPSPIEGGLEESDSRLGESYGDFETSFRRNYPFLWWATLIGPAIVTGTVVLLLYQVMGNGFTTRLVSMGAAALFFFGRFIILGGLNPEVAAVTQGVTSESLFWMVCYLDLMLAILLAFHIGYLFRIPIIGPKVAGFASDARFILDSQPWMKRATFIGLICFVGFPLSATGAVGGSIFGRLLGLNRVRTFCGILVGAAFGNLMMYTFADFIHEHLPTDSPAVKYGGIAIIVVAILLLNGWYKRLKARYMQQGDSPVVSDDG